MWPVVAAAALIALALASKSIVHKGEPDREVTTTPVGPRPSPVPPPLPGPTPTPTTTPADVKRKADEAKKKLPILIRSPDKPATDVPVIDGKAAWFQARERTGKRVPITDINIGNMIVPNFSTILAVFKTLQATVGANPDGRIGRRTLNAFIAKIVARGFKKHPRTVAQLAANAVKYNEILQKGYKPDQVGSDDPWEEFVTAMESQHPEDVSPSGKLGMFAQSPRRLEKLGIMTDVSKHDTEDGPMYMGAFAEFELEEFLDNPELQYAVFLKNMKDYATKVRNTDLHRLVGTHTPYGPVTMSGLLGLCHTAGVKGAASWITNPEDAHRFPHTTEMFQRTNNIF